MFDVWFVLVGDGVDWSDLWVWVFVCVVMFGFMNEFENCLVVFDIFVSVVCSEFFGLVFLEVMYVGLFIVVIVIEGVMYFFEIFDVLVFCENVEVLVVVLVWVYEVRMNGVEV